jgi:hypothetical protein
MQSVRQMVLRVMKIVGKAIVVRAFAVGPVSRKQEAEIRAFLAADPAMWGHGPRTTD